MARMLGRRAWFGLCVCPSCDPGTHNATARYRVKRQLKARERAQLRRTVFEETG